MRMLVLADSHGNAAMIQRAVEQQPAAELVVYLGDGIAEFHRIIEHYPHKEFWCVRGNCDFSSQEESTSVAWAREVKVLFTHGHQWNVKCGMDDIKNQARKVGAQLALFGHTHTPYYEYDNGLTLLNPGSVGNPRGGIYPSYATIDIHGKSIICNHVEIKKW